MRDRRRRAGDDANKIAQLGFRHRSSSFGVFAAAAGEIAAVQRGWRDFRIAPSSCEREILRCQKIGRSSDCRDPINENSGGHDESARGRQHIFPRQT